MPYLDQVVDLLKRAPRKLRRRALRLHKRLMKRKTRKTRRA